MVLAYRISHFNLGNVALREFTKIYKMISNLSSVHKKKEKFIFYMLWMNQGISEYDSTKGVDIPTLNGGSHGVEGP